MSAIAMKIITEMTLQPTPNRNWDWVAYVDGQEEGPRGYGCTPKEAEIALGDAMFLDGDTE